MTELNIFMSFHISIEAGFLCSDDVLLNYSNTFNLHIDIFRQRFDSNTTPCWFRISKCLNQRPLRPESYLLINLIHVRKVLHIGKEHIHLDDRIDTRSGSLENGAQIGETLFLELNNWLMGFYSMSFNVAINECASGIRGNLASMSEH
jgi:hypothetical protein